ncbi:unnamed protein product [Linum tenue]|uniref:Amino acid transporter transmembrane domain-containing protein n=1 Tax=Linum tenue TaxID=586396 RepID=A0AAV0JIY9_9ROSI|nr:unnamed protein product [Linum tenue]
MKNSASDESLNYVESEDDVDEENKDVNGGGGKYGLNRLASEESVEEPGDDRHASHTPSWPQSYRMSMDMYSSVSPTINFLKSPLSRQGSSFLRVRRRPTSEVLVTEAAVPLLLHDDQDHHHYHYDDEKGHRVVVKQEQLLQKSSHHLSLGGLPSQVDSPARKSSFGQALLNGVNVLCGIGILSTPYAVKQGGWLGLIVLLLFALLSFYTGLLLRYCLDTHPGLQTYPDIGQAAFGTTGRIAFAVILYVELYACCVEYIILESDNLSALFPNAHLSLGGVVEVELDPHHLFAFLTTLAVLPTVWLRDLSILSYISVYVGVGVMGYTMFGEATESQFTLNMPSHLLASKIAVWTTVVNPFTKYPFPTITYALTMTPVAMSLEELIPSNKRSYLHVIAIRTLLVISTLAVAISVPFFGPVLSLIGSLLTMFVTLILPCASYLSILRNKVNRYQVSLCVLVIAVGLICSAFGTYSAVLSIVRSLGA